MHVRFVSPRPFSACGPAVGHLSGGQGVASSILARLTIDNPFSVWYTRGVRSFEYKGLVDGEWVSMPVEEWNSFLGRRMLADLEYHGPAFVGRAPSRERRECRCDSCTLFEVGREISPAVQTVVDAMLVVRE